MPQIPIYQPSQATNVGSPVPVNSPSNTGDAIRAEAFSKFGAGMADLGLAILSVKNKAAKEEARLEASRALDAKAEAWQKRVELFKEETFDPKDDPAGINAVERLQKDIDETEKQILKNLNPLAQKYYLADNKKIDVDYKAKAFAVEADKRAKNVEVLLDLRMNDLSNRTRQEAATSNNPGQALVMNVAAGAKDIMMSEHLGDAQKRIVEAERRKDHVNNFFNGLIEGGRFELAKAYLDKDIEGSDIVRATFNSVETQEIRERINRAENRKEDELYQRAQRAKAAEKERLESLRDKSMQRLTNRLADAKSDQKVLDLVYADIDDDPFLSPEDKISLRKTTAFSERTDDEFELGVNELTARGTTSTELIRRVKNGVKEGKVTIGRAENLIKAIKAQDEVNPNVKAAQAAARQAISDLGKNKRRNAWGQEEEFGTTAAYQSARLALEKDFQILADKKQLTVDTVLRAAQTRMSNATGMAINIEQSLMPPGAKITSSPKEAREEAIRLEMDIIQNGKTMPIDELRLKKQLRDYYKNMDVRGSAVDVLQLKEEQK